MSRKRSHTFEVDTDVPIVKCMMEMEAKDSLCIFVPSEEAWSLVVLDDDTKEASGWSFGPGAWRITVALLPMSPQDMRMYAKDFGAVEGDGSPDQTQRRSPWHSTLTRLSTFSKKLASAWTRKRGK